MAEFNLTTAIRIVVKILGLLGIILSAQLMMAAVSIDYGSLTVFPYLNIFIVGLLIFASVLALLT